MANNKFKFRTICFSCLFLFFAPICFSQSQGEALFGMTFHEIEVYHSNLTPCEVTPKKVLTYCVRDGSRMSYVFEDNKVIGIMFLTIQLTRYKAEIALEEAVASYSTTHKLTPFYNKGQAIFSNPSSRFSISYGIGEFGGSIYLIYYKMLIP